MSSMVRLRSIAGILVCLVGLLSACGSRTLTGAGTSQPEDTTENSPEQVTPVPASVTGTAPVAPSVGSTGVLQSPLPEPNLAITPAPDDRATRQLSPLPLPIKPGLIGAQDPVPGEVPADLLQSILRDLQERKGIGREEIAIERAEAVVWRDGSLGCPKPGMMYTQALIPGYRVVLNAGGEQYNYHASESGRFMLCEQGLPGQIIPPGGGADPLPEKQQASPTD